MSFDSVTFDSSNSKERPSRTSSDRAVQVDRDQPRFSSSGRLPPGVHEVSIEGLASLVRFNERRLDMWRRLCAFLLWPAESGDFTAAYLGGGFLSSRPDPDDIDLVLQTKHAYGTNAFKAIEPFFSTGLHQIQEVYGVHLHFWMEKAPDAICDFRVFFQYARPERPVRTLDPARGVAKLNLTAPESSLSLQRFTDGGSQAQKV